MPLVSGKPGWGHNVALEDVTPVVLTFNEEANIGRTLLSLQPFPRVVVVDSGSTDRTEEIARSNANVAWFCNRFEGHVRQWIWALTETAIETPWVLALDADMAVAGGLADELAAVAERPETNGGVVAFEYRIRGCALAGSLYPPQLRLFRLQEVRVVDAGHTQEFQVTGRVAELKERLAHDDRKPLEAFVLAQLRYSALERPRLADVAHAQKPKAWLRRVVPFTPLAVWLYAWARAGGPLRGAAARRYALERLIYEAMLRWRVEDASLRNASREERSSTDQGSDL